MSRKEEIEKCPKCGCTTQIETIHTGIKQRVWYNKDNFITKEETTYEPTMNNSTYECAECHEKI